MNIYASIAHSILGSLGLAAILSLGACAHEQTLSPEQLASAESPVRAAREAGAEKIPAAALYLKLAREGIDLGKTLAEKNDERATTVLARAQADAELALALAEESTTEAQARALMDELKAASL